MLNSKDLILHEVNVKEIIFLHDNESSIIIKSAKPDFKKLGPRAGSSMKEIGLAIQGFTEKELSILELNDQIDIKTSNGSFTVMKDEVEIVTKDVEGWQVAVNGKITVALDLTLNEQLRLEGYAREIVNKIQNMRKDNGYEVNDRINVKITPHNEIDHTLLGFKNYICNEILADTILNEQFDGGEIYDINGIEVKIIINKTNGN